MPSRQPAVPQRAAIYCRISQDRTGERLGVARQEQECRELAERRGWIIEEVYDRDNDRSAYSGKRRPDWERLLEDIREGRVDGLIAWHLDRCLRRLVDLIALLDALDNAPRPVQVAFKTSGDIDLNTPSGRLLASILASVAVNESAQKADRVQAARRQEASRGIAHTALGYGYNVDQTINESEATVVREVKNRLFKGQTMLSIVSDLNRRGVPTPGREKWTGRHVTRSQRLDTTSEPLRVLVDRLMASDPIKQGELARLTNKANGKQEDTTPWTAAAIRTVPKIVELLDDPDRNDTIAARVLTLLGVPPDRMYWRSANLGTMMRRGALCGWREYSPGGRGGVGELVAKGTWDPILTRGETDRIRQMLDRTKSPDGKGGGRPAKYLLSGILRCGRCQSPMGGSFDKKSQSVRYACAQQPGLPERCGKVTITGAPVDAMVTEAVIDQLAESNFRRGLGRAPSTAAGKALQERIEALETNLAGYDDDAAKFIIDRDRYNRITAGLNAELKDAYRALGRPSEPLRRTLQGVPTQRPQIVKWWEAAGLEAQRQIVKVLIAYVPVAPARKQSNRFDPARVGAPVMRPGL